MAKVAQQVECPNCWHCFDPVGKSTNPAYRVRRKGERFGHCEVCSVEFETTSGVKRFCSRRCQLAARRAA